MTLDAVQFMDPMIVLERKQNRQLMKVQQCGECVNAKMIFGNEPRCTVRKQTFGYRCEFFKKADE